jgi:hypothetical protein
MAVLYLFLVRGQMRGFIPQLMNLFRGSREKMRVIGGMRGECSSITFNYSEFTVRERVDIEYGGGFLAFKQRLSGIAVALGLIRMMI